MSKRVTKIVQDGCTLYVHYSDCAIEIVDLAGCGDKTPESKKPGDWPSPDPVADVRCRVAIKVGELAAQRLNNYLSGINLTNPLANLPAFYTAAEIAEYGWSISLYDAMINFYYDVMANPPGTPGDAAKTDWDANSATITSEVQEALYCVLPDTGEIDDQTRLLWAAGLESYNTEFHSLLADLLNIWPLAQLREMAFNASTTTDSVDCAAFDCGGAGIGSWCYTWDFTTAQGNWEPEGAEEGLGGAPQAQYFPGQGWGIPNPPNPGFSGRGVSIRLTDTMGAVQISRIEFTISVASPNPPPRYIVYDAVDNDPSTGEAFVTPVGSTSIVANLNPQLIYERFAFGYRRPFGSGTYPGFIRSVTLYGFGAMPPFTGGAVCES